MTPAVSAKLLELTNDLNNEVKLSAIYALGECFSNASSCKSLT